jgi:hypothetical protein
MKVGSVKIVKRMSTVVLPMKKIEPAVKSGDRMNGNTNTIVVEAFSLATGRMAVLSDTQFHMTFAVATRLAADNS